MEGGGPMKGILNGVFNYAHSNFGLCRRNYKFYQKEVNFFIKNLKSTHSSWIGASHTLNQWTKETSNELNQMYLFLFKNNQVLSLSSIAYFLIFATTCGPLLWYLILKKIYLNFQIYIFKR